MLWELRLVKNRVWFGSRRKKVSKYDSIDDFFYFETGASVGPQAGVGMDLKKEKAFETEKLNAYALNSKGIVKF